MNNSDHPRSPACLTPLLGTDFYPLLFSGSGSMAAISKAVNLALFLTVLYLLVRKPAREFFQQRLAEVRATLEGAARQKSEAAAKMAELETRLAKLDDEIAEIRAAGEREAAAERARLEIESRAEADKLRATAQREIEGAKQNALIELKQFTADKAVELAEQLIRRELKPDDDVRLVRRAGEEMAKVK